MTTFDYVVIIIVAVSIIYGLSRGVIKEVLSILGWVAAFIVANRFSGLLVPFMPNSIPTNDLKALAAVIVLFIGTLFIIGMVVSLLSKAISTVGLGWLNNVLGAIFGFFRGFLIVGVIVYLAGLTKLPSSELWQNAILSQSMERFVLSALEFGPNFLKDKVEYPARDVT